jgi:hypothetical protein
MIKYNRIINAYVLATTMLLISCGQSADNKNNSKESSPAENAEISVPGIEKLAFTDSVQLKANENMRFDKELFRSGPEKNQSHF